MLDDTLLLTVYDLVFVIMTSCAHCHTIIHIQPYRYKHTQQSYTYKQTHTIMQWCCTRVYETFLWKAVPIPGLCACIVQLSGLIVGSLVSAPATRAVYGIACQNFCFCACHLAVDQVDFENDGVCACNRWSSRDWLSDPWALRLPPVQFTRLMVRSLVSALRLPPGSLPGWFSNVGARACHRWSSAGWLSDPWSACHPCNLREWWLDQVASLFSAPATRAIDRIDCQTVGLCARRR